MNVNIFCSKCDDVTGHLHIHGRLCICSTCGQENKAKTIIKEPVKPAPTEGVMILSDATKAEIVTRRTAGERCDDLAKEYGVTGQTIRNICNARGPRPAKIRIGKSTPQQEQAVGLRARIEQLVEEAVNRRLAGLGLDNLDAKIEAAIVRALR